MGDHLYFVYIITNVHNTTIYTGVTNDILRRIDEHKRGEGGLFSWKYKLKKLVYFEIYGDINAAIAREKQIKAGSRMKELELIHSMNPNWDDLALDIDK